MERSVAEFIKMAEKSACFDNTVFVFFGDHGIHAATGSHIPASEARSSLQGLRVPFVIYGKSIIKQVKVFDTIAREDTTKQKPGPTV